MIVRPDFPDHYKTRLLVELTGDGAAPVWVLRLWAHCQNSRTWRFRNLSPAALKAICQANSLTAERFHEIMLQTRFIEIDGDETAVRNWDEFNASLIANWDNGRKGGRPPKSRNSGEVGSLGVSSAGAGVSQDVPPTDKRPSKTQTKPVGCPRGNPQGTDKRREDRIGEESSLREDEEGKPSLPSGDGSGEVGSLGVSSAGAGVSQDVPPTDKRRVLDEIVELFHTLCPTLPKVRKVDGQRLKSVRARWRAATGKTDAEKLEWFRSLFSAAGSSRKIRDGGWCAFDWLMTPRYSQRVLEGNYADGRENTTRKPKFDQP